MFCGYPISSDESLKKSVGGGCRHKNKSTKSKWRNKVERTVNFREDKPVSLDNGKSHWAKMDGFWVNDKGGSKVKSDDFEKLLMKNKLILNVGDVDEELLSKIKDNLDDFFENGLDKNDNVV